MTAQEIVSKMLEKDEFTKQLGIQLIEVGAGYCTLEMQVVSWMNNGFDLTHGGISYSLADSALAFASNSQGRHAVSIETSISHISQVKEGDVLIAKATEEKLGRRIAFYSVSVSNQDSQLVALFKGTVYRSDRPWI